MNLHLQFQIMCLLMISWGYIVYTDEKNKQTRRKLAAWTIALLCVGIVIIAGAASAEWCPRSVNFENLLTSF